MTIEYRFVRGESPGEDEGRLDGRVTPFNTWTQIGNDKWGFKERIAPGTFKKSLAERDIVLLDNHDTAKPLARTSAGTLSLEEKSGSGLHFDATPADTTYAQDVVKNVRAKNYGGMSFGFEVLQDKWKRGERGQPDERTIHEVRLHEVSVVTFPAYGSTSVNARDSFEAAREARERALGPIDGDETEDRDDKPKSKPYGNVTYADPKNGKYPIDTKEHAGAAWNYINVAANAAKYPLNGVSLASVKAKIKAACKKFGIETKAEFSADDARAMLELIREEGIAEDQAARILTEVLEEISRSEEGSDPYEDEEFYERDDDSKDQSDASDSDAGAKPCATCDDTGKDKSGNKCATCGGSKAKNGDGKNHETGPGKEKKSDPETDLENGEPGSSTRSDEDRRDALRRMKFNMRNEPRDSDSQ